MEEDYKHEFLGFHGSISMRFKLLEPPQLILRENNCEMTILQQVEIIVFFLCHIFGQLLLILCGLWLLHKCKAHIKGHQICFRIVQVKNGITDNAFVTL